MSSACEIMVNLSDLPEEALLRVLVVLDAEALACVSLSSRWLRDLCVQHAWPVLAARAAGVAALRPAADAELHTVRSWLRLVRALKSQGAARTLHVVVQLARTDSVRALALRYAVSPHDILRSNALLQEYHLATRARLYVPLSTDARVREFTGQPIAAQRPEVVRDTTLASRHFLVVGFHAQAPVTETADAAERRAAAVRELIVRLFARGFSVSEAEVRFYLDDNNFNLARAYKAFLNDRDWADFR